MTVVFDDYLEALLNANTSAATELLDDALMRGTSPVSLIRDIIGHGQQEIGESWARGSLSAGEEHAASRSHEASRRESDVRDDAASSVPRGGRGRCRATRPIAEQTCPSSPDRQQPRHLKCPIGPISRGGTPRSSVASWQKRTKGPRPCPVADADPWVGRAGPRGVVHLGVDRGRLDPVVERPPGLACVGHRRHRSRGLQIPRARDRLQLQGPAGRTSASGDLDHADVEQVWAYSLIVTNLDISTPEKARSVECWHRHRTDIE